ncbi:unnamed protein product [Lepeophtheirus salmonis]|uniref:(salmon louse) hypothetical protein n=1 Tax=Lepeophtheirus salmonis TaxID=72036 RepID=A0A7R8H8Z0_LEPSM|nr:unnamed protein product [Lepeophtheirus salmonis]CAF2931152.1 unnamed protein product [Lepeophtheirus salmonis]
MLKRIKSALATALKVLYLDKVVLHCSPRHLDVTISFSTSTTRIKKGWMRQKINQVHDKHCGQRRHQNGIHSLLCDKKSEKSNDLKSKRGDVSRKNDVCEDAFEDNVHSESGIVMEEFNGLIKNIELKEFDIRDNHLLEVVSQDKSGFFLLMVKGILRYRLQS